MAGVVFRRSSPQCVCGIFFLILGNAKSISVDSKTSQPRCLSVDGKTSQRFIEAISFSTTHDSTKKVALVAIRDTVRSVCYSTTVESVGASW